MWVPTELVWSHSQGCGEKGEKGQVSGGSRWVSSQAWSEQTSEDIANTWGMRLLMEASLVPVVSVTQAERSPCKCPGS